MDEHKWGQFNSSDWVKKLLDDGFVIESTLNLGEIDSRLVEDYLTENRMMKSGDFELVRGGIYSSV